jgi:hypothetical protein
MKYFVIISVSALLLTGCETSSFMESSTIPVEEQTVLTDEAFVSSTLPVVEMSTVSFGSEGALSSTDPSIEEMLLYAIEDELRAKAEYEMIMDTYDVTKPFSNIANSEQTHINMLLPLLEAYDVDYDEEEILDHIIEIHSLLEAYEVGVIAEIANIAMYDMFLTYDIPEDLIRAFTALRDGSYNHLAAFEKGVERSS